MRGGLVHGDPWLGFPLADLVQMVRPLSAAKFARFETAYRPDEMRGTRSSFALIDWPYVEGLRMDEAMHPSTCWRLECMGGYCLIRMAHHCGWSYLEVWLQKHQIDRADQLCTRAAAYDVAVDGS